MNLHKEIKSSILKHLNFLQNLGFTNFVKEQLAYEIHLFCKRDNVKIDICYELIYSTPIWITINGIHVEILEQTNQTISDIYQKKEQLYKQNFDKYLKSDKTKYLKNNKENYNEIGHLLNDEYIKEISEILKRNEDVVLGNLNKIKNIEHKIKKVRDKEKRVFNEQNGIYNCEYNWNGLICEHKGTLKEIEEHLIERKDMKLTDIIIFDWNGNKIKREK